LAASYGDLTALALAIAAPSSSTLDKVGAGINLVKFVEAFTALVKNIPIVSTAVNSADLTVNAAKAKVDIDTLGYVSNANYAALLSSVTSITSGAAFTAAIGGVVIAGLSAPVLVAITLAEAQTQVSFALVSDEDISADQTGAISVSLHTAQGDTPSARGQQQLGPDTERQFPSSAYFAGGSAG
jgi:hypothetical protein